MASKTLSLNKLVSSDFSEGSSWVLNKGGGGDTDVGYFVFNSIGSPYVKITNVSFKINAIETGGNNLFGENIYLNFEFGTYSGSTFTKSNSFSFGQQGVKESENQVSRTATASGSASLSGSGLCIKLTITPQSNSIGSKIVMSGFSLTVTYEVETCTATFKNYDGTVLDQKQVEKGSTPSYTGATPASYIVDWQYANVFSGWDKAISAITADTTYTAVFTPALRKYYVDLTIINENDVVEDVNISGVYQFYNYNDTVTLAVDLPHINVMRWTIRSEEIKEQSLTLKLDDETLQKYCLEIFMPETLTSYITVAVDYSYKYYYIVCEANPKEGGKIARQGQDGSYGTGSYWSQYGSKYNSTVNFLAKPNVGYSFIKWSDGATENPRAITFTEDATYIAYFEPIPPPEFTSVEMKYLDKQISSSNKVLADEGFIIAVGIT